MTIGFYVHDRDTRTPRGQPTVAGPFWCSLRRGYWKFVTGRFAGVPDQLIIRFGGGLRQVLAVGREGWRMVVHVC